MIEVLAIAWLALCAWQDWHHRKVSNWLMLPPVILTLVLRLAGVFEGQLILMALTLAAVFIAWIGHGAGGADLKVMTALALIDARLALWAWTGATAWYALLFLYGRFVVKDRNRIRLPGMLGFLIGVGAYWVWL